MAKSAHPLEQPDHLIAVCRQGLEGVVAKELRALGLTVRFEGVRMVAFEGQSEALYRAAMGLHAAISVLKPLRRFKARNPDMLYYQTRKVRWPDLFAPHCSLRIDMKGRAPQLPNDQFNTYRIKDGIVDTFKSLAGVRPDIAKREADIHIVAYLHRDEVTLYLDAAGEPLFKRGYRRIAGEAPLKEDLAAGILQLSGWDGTTPLLDPMCGSGTFLAEAWLLAARRAPNPDRAFACENWADFDEETFTRVKNELRARERPVTSAITGYESDWPTYEAARRIAADLFPKGAITVHCGSFQDRPEEHPGAFVVCNPPYGVRLAPKGLDNLYRELGRFLKNKCPGAAAAILTANFKAANALGMAADQKWTLYNGGIECRLFKYGVRARKD